MGQSARTAQYQQNRIITSQCADPVRDLDGGTARRLQCLNARSSNHEPNQEADRDPKRLSGRDSFLCEQAQCVFRIRTTSTGQFPTGLLPPGQFLTRTTPTMDNSHQWATPHQDDSIPTKTSPQQDTSPPGYLPTRTLPHQDNFPLRQLPSRTIPHYHDSPPVGNCPSGELSWWRLVKLRSCPGGE